MSVGTGIVRLRLSGLALVVALLTPAGLMAGDVPELLNSQAEVVALESLLGREYTILYLSRITPELAERDIPNLRSLALQLGGGVNGAFILVGEPPGVAGKASSALDGLLPVLVGGKSGLGFLDPGIADNSLVVLDGVGELLFRRDDIPAPATVEEALSLGGLTPPSVIPIQVGEVVPTFDLPAVEGKLAMGDMVKRGAAVFYLVDAGWGLLEEDVQRMQFLADDLFEVASVAVLVYGAEMALLEELIGEKNLTIPLGILSEVAHRSLVGEEPLPLLIVVNDQGRVMQVNSYASPPGMEQALAYINLEQRELRPMSVEFSSETVLLSGIESKWFPRGSFTYDGMGLIYNAYSPDSDAEELWLLELSVDEEGDYAAGKVRRLTYNRADDISPWVGGGWIFFLSLRSGVVELWAYHLAGKNFTQLTSSDCNEEFPASPLNGEEVVFQSDAQGNWDLWLCSPYGRNLKQLTDHWAEDYHPAYSSDGTRRIAFCSERGGSPDIWVVGRDGRGLTQLTFYEGREGFPTWNRDGTRIVYCSDEGGSLDIWLISDDGMEVARVSEEPGDELCPIFSPSGDAIIYFVDNGGNYDIVCVGVSEVIEEEGGGGGVEEDGQR